MKRGDQWDLWRWIGHGKNSGCLMPIAQLQGRSSHVHIDTVPRFRYLKGIHHEFTHCLAGCIA